MQLGYIYNSKDERVLFEIVTIYNDKTCYIKHIGQEYPKSDTFETNAHSFTKTSTWKQYLKRLPTAIFEEKFNDF